MPRLTKGQLAPGIRLRHEVSMSSAQARIALMLVLKERGTISDADAAPFKSFDVLCKHSDRALSIFPISPKTLRKHVAANFDGGLPEFRKLLKWCGGVQSQAFEETKNYRKDSSSSLSLATTDAVLEITTRYADLLERMAKLAVSQPTARAQLQAHFRVFPEQAGHLRLIK